MEDSDTFELYDLRFEVVAGVPETVPGAVCEAERDRTGPHGRIMRYDLGRDGQEARA